MAKESSFGERLRWERERRNWTQEQLAEEVEVSVPTIHRWENDESTPRLRMYNKLYQVFGKTAETFGMVVPRQIAWNVPFLRNPYFTGRKQILLDLHRVLAAYNPVALSQTRAISGLGGIGKTQTALEYAYQYANEYEAVLWVRADSRETLVSDFASLAQTLDLKEKAETDQFRIVGSVKLWLQNHSPWLLIFDNADDLSVVSDFLPRRHCGAVLLTTRSQVTGPYITKIEMERMSCEEGVVFLLRRMTSRGNQEGEKDCSMGVADIEIQAAQKLWEVMDGLPLALDQAGAYIEARRCSLTDYLELYSHHREVLLRERGGLVPEHPDTVATTWSLSFQKVEQKNLAAAELLRFCAFLSPDAIPEELLTKGAAHFPTSLQTVATSAPLLNDAIGTLLIYSLIRRDPATHMFSLHRLVQIVLQDTLTETERRFWAERAVLAINALFPKVEHKTWPQCERLLPHTLLVSQHIERLQIANNKEAGRLLTEAAIYLRERSRYHEAESLLLQALQIRKQHLGSEHLDVAISLNNLASLYMYQGKYELVESLCEQARKIYDLQPEHVGGDAPLHTLATLYIYLGKYEQAEPLLLQALQIRKQQLGLEHLDVATSLNNLASLYMYQGKYELAESVFLQAQKIYEQQPEHPNLAYLLNNLAELYLDQGNYAEAEALYLRARRICEQQLGLNHHGTAHPLNGLANLYREQKNYAGAEALYLQALQIYEQHVKPEHPDIVAPLHGLANLYREQKNYAKAVALYQRALHILERTLGREQPETAGVIYDFAQLQEAQNNHEAAKISYAHVLAVRKRAFGVHHPKAIEVRKRLIALLHIMGQHEEATRLETDQTES